MVLGHMEKDGFHPHNGGSGIHSSELIHRNTSGDLVLPSKKRDLKVKGFIEKQREKFKEKERLKNHSSDNPHSESRQKELEQRRIDDKFNRIMQMNLSERFMISKLKEFKKENADNISPTTLGDINVAIKNLEDDLKERDKAEREKNETKKKSGTDVLFPKGSQNADKTGEDKLTESEKISRRNENIRKELEERNKKNQKHENETRLQLQKIQQQEKELANRQSMIQQNNSMSPERKQTMTQNVKQSKDELEIKKKRILKGKSQAEALTLASLGVS